MSAGDRRNAVAMVDAAALGLVSVAALALGLGLMSQNGTKLAFVALIASFGGLLFLGLGVLRQPGAPPSSG